jgi:predicted molibdopterin-dependent oxidoreductase YjgC
MKKGEELVEVGWDEAISAAASALKAFRKSEIAAISSPFATNEENHIFRRFAAEVLVTRNVDFIRREIPGDEDDILIRADKTPNSRGAEEVGIEAHDGGLDLEGIRKAIEQGSIKALYCLDNDPTAAIPLTVLAKLDLLVMHAVLENEATRIADVVFPLATYAEKNGTFTNFQGRVQRIRPSVAVLEADRSLDGFAMSRLDRFGTQFDRWARGARRDARPAWKVIAALAGLMGTRYKFNTAEEVFNDLTQHVRSFKGLTYAKLGSKGAMLAKVAERIPAGGR